MLDLKNVPQWLCDIANEYLDEWSFVTSPASGREVLYIVDNQNRGLSVASQFDFSKYLTVDDKSTIYHNIKRFADGMFFDKEF